MHIAERGLLEVVIWSAVVVSRMMARAVGFLLEWFFVAAAWIALFVIGAVMAFQRSSLPWTNAAAARATSRSADSTGRRTLRR